MHALKEKLSVAEVSLAQERSVTEQTESTCNTQLTDLQAELTKATGCFACRFQNSAKSQGVGGAILPTRYVGRRSLFLGG